MYVWQPPIYPKINVDCPSCNLILCLDDETDECTYTRTHARTHARHSGSDDVTAPLAEIMADTYLQGRQANGQTSYALHPISNYTFGTKAPKVEKDTSVKERLDRMKHKCASAV